MYEDTDIHTRRSGVQTRRHSLTPSSFVYCVLSSHDDAVFLHPLSISLLLHRTSISPFRVFIVLLEVEFGRQRPKSFYRRLKAVVEVVVANFPIKRWETMLR